MLLKKIYYKIKYKLIDFQIRHKNNRFFRKSYPKLTEYKNKFNGQRCFIIGNGPSLTVEDLEKLNNSVTIASHGIYHIYDKTSWRPTFYCAQDSKLINSQYDYIKDRCGDSFKFFGVVNNRKYPKFRSSDIAIELLNENFVDGYPKFSENALDGFYEGMTVTYFNIQLAVYMGFKEIYLLGIDHFYTGGADDHFSKEDKCTNIPQLDKSTCAYQRAKEYADSNNVKILNATRGGHLEVFERVNFENLF